MRPNLAFDSPAHTAAHCRSATRLSVLSSILIWLANGDDKIYSEKLTIMETWLQVAVIFVICLTLSYDICDGSVTDTPSVSQILPQCHRYSLSVTDTPSVSQILPQCHRYSLSMLGRSNKHTTFPIDGWEDKTKCGLAQFCDVTVGRFDSFADCLTMLVCRVYFPAVWSVFSL